MKQAYLHVTSTIEHDVFLYTKLMAVLHTIRIVDPLNRSSVTVRKLVYHNYRIKRRVKAGLPPTKCMLV